MLYFLSFCLLFNKIANAQFRSEGDERDPLQALDVPFVPEDFRSSPKRIIFDKNDYVSLLPSQDLQKPLTDAIIKLLQETQVRANDSKTYHDIRLQYAGLAKLGGRPGHSAHFAATVQIQVCERNLTICHYEECDLDLDQKDEADPHDYKPVFTLHSKECSRQDSWCYFCQAFDDTNDLKIEGPESCQGSQYIRRNCNAKNGDLSAERQWGCMSKYTIVAGQHEIIAKDCIAVPNDTFSNHISDCQSLDDSDYEVQCSCQGSGCNLRDDYEELETITPDPILDEVNRSIRQLRADLQRTIRRYARN